MKHTRREALARLGAGLALATTLTTQTKAQNKKRFPIGACEWSLRKSDPGCFALAKEIGLDGVEVDLGNPGNGLHMRRKEVQEAYKKASAETGVAIASLATAVFNNIGLKSEPRAAIWLNDSIDIAVNLGVKVILVAQFFNGDLRNDKPGTERTIDLLKELAPRAEKAGVILGLENYHTARENLDIIGKVASKAVQVYYDVGNSTDMGYDIYAEIPTLKGQLCAVHAKDGSHMLGKGRIDFAKVRAALDTAEYSGWIQIEAAAPKNLTQDYQEHLKFLRSHFSS